MDCLFCDILNGKKDGHFLYEDNSHVAILEATGADAFSIGQNNGRAAKQIVPHVHIHIIPRYNNKGTVWTKRQISNDDELSELAKKIRSLLT